MGVPTHHRMTWERFHAAPKVQMEIVERSEPQEPRRAAATIRLLLTLAVGAVALHGSSVQRQAPSVVLPMPAPTPFEECVAQSDADLLAQCDDLLPGKLGFEVRSFLRLDGSSNCSCEAVKWLTM